ncbi:hypothetical protein BGZ54_001045 [Gamsiella multidivaricata]|nr:hypothetical protein BGZ54_001045 [Gamsiella multidivaricata]
MAGPIVLFPLSAPMPTMPHQWIALIPCAVKGVDAHAIQQLDASAIVLYPTLSADCFVVSALKGSSIPLMVLGQESAEQLIYTLDSLSHGALAMVTLSKEASPFDEARTKSTELEMNNINSQQAQGNGKETSDGGNIKTHQIEKQRHVFISLPEIASLVDSFASGAAAGVRRVLMNLGLDTQHADLRAPRLNEQPLLDKESVEGHMNVMTSISYRSLSRSSQSKQDRTRVTEYSKAAAGKHGAKEGSQGKMEDTLTEPAPTANTVSSSSGPEISSIRHSKTRTRPNRLAQRVHPTLPSKVLDEVQSSVLRKDSRHSNGINSFWSSSYIQYRSGNGPTSISGRLAMALMSTICGVGIGMFGALLFVVALKIRLFQSRRSSHSSHPHQGGHQQQRHQQIRESGDRKVIPKAILESYGIHTVLEITVDTVMLTSTCGKTQSDMGLFAAKRKLPYAEDVIEMEEGLQDIDVRENAQRQMLHRRRTGSGQVLLRRETGAESCEEEENEGKEEEVSGNDGEESNDDGEECVCNDHDGDEEENWHEDAATAALTETPMDMNMEQITTASLTVTQEDSYRRIAVGRQGRLNHPIPSSPSFASMSSSVSSGTTRCCSSHDYCRRKKKKKKKAELPFANANAQTITNSSGSSVGGYSQRTGNGNLATRSNTTGSSFQERMKERDREKQQREREEREAAARAIRDEPRLNAALNQAANATATAAAAAQTTGSALWNRLRAAKDVINATITGEERWPDSDDSDHEGESHVRRVLREYADKKEAQEMAAKIAELELTPIVTVPTRSGSLSRNRLRDALGHQRMDHHQTTITSNAAASPPNSANSNSSMSSTSTTQNYYGQSLRARDESGHQSSHSEDSAPGSLRSGLLSPPPAPATTNVRIGNRFRTSSDASLSKALGRLEGKRNQDALEAQVSHLGSTRARSPHRGQRAYKDNIDTVPPPPLPTPKSSFRQQLQQQKREKEQGMMMEATSPTSPTSPTRRMNNNLGVYGQRRQIQQQQQDF